MLLSLGDFCIDHPELKGYVFDGTEQVEVSEGWWHHISKDDDIPVGIVMLGDKNTRDGWNTDYETDNHSDDRNGPRSLVVVTIHMSLEISGFDDETDVNAGD